MVKQLNLQSVIAELLHIGTVVEKGRCYGFRWKHGYRKTLKNHVEALNLLQLSLQYDDIEKKKNALSQFIDTCNRNPDFGRFYTHAFIQLSVLKIEGTDSVHYFKTEKLINELFMNLLTEIDLLFPSHRRIYYLLCSLHNLPRVYFDVSKQGLCGENGGPIPEDEALQYLINRR